MTQKHKIDIFAVLNKASTKDDQWFDTLTEDDQKQLHPLLIQRWLSGTSSAQQVFLLNEIVNPFVFSLFKHKQLLWQLCTVATSGKSQRYQWMGQKSEAGKNKPASTQVVADYYGYSLRHARDAVKCLTKEQIVDLATELGAQPETIAKIKKEHDANGSKSDK